MSTQPSMLPRRPAIYRFTRPPALPRRHSPWRHTLVRRYAVTSAPDANANVDAEPAWLQSLRADMLAREATHFYDEIFADPEIRLANTLTGFLPPAWCRPATAKRPVIMPGHHLIWFNSAVPADRLLPDGTDVLQSPGAPWVRRMWAGGSVVTRPENYFHHKDGFVLGAAMAGVEHIKDVRLRGCGDTAKLFVTIERRFARVDQLFTAYKKKYPGDTQTTRRTVADLFQKQLQDTGWGDSILAEERELVFLKEDPAIQLDTSGARLLAPIKYLNPPGTPEISHMLIPTSELLFRFSALTFNAHRIHLDRDYARRVEGHRNLLVHGPLSLALMMQFMSKHVTKGDTGPHVIHRLDYRNLAPLYCDEPMRICASKKDKAPSATCDVYDVWIEGPTGGMAVKGTVHTTMVRKRTRTINTQKTAQAAEVGKDTPNQQRTHQAHSDTYGAIETPYNSSPLSSSSQEPVEIGPFRRTRKRDFMSPKPKPLVRRVDTFVPLKQRISPFSEHLIDRLTYRNRQKLYVKPSSLVRRYAATPYEPDFCAHTGKRLTFRKHGARRIYHLVCRRTPQRRKARPRNDLF